MVKQSSTLVEIMRLKINVTQADIDGGECRLATRCMHKVAIARVLLDKGVIKSDAEGRVRVDAGHIRCNANGYRWKGDTPKRAEVTLKAFDRKEKVRPHSYTITLRKGGKVIKVPRERQERVNEVRRERIAAGEYNYPRYKSIHQRVVGY